MDKYLDSSSGLVLSLPSVGQRTNEEIVKENRSLLSAIKKINSLSKSEEVILDQSYDPNSIICNEKNIRSLKNSLIMQESADLHWFTEDSFKDYDNKNLLDHSGINFDTQDAMYHIYSRDIDANLAEIDIETFRSEDINTIYVLPNSCLPQKPTINAEKQTFASVSDFLCDTQLRDDNLSSFKLKDSNRLVNSLIDSNHHASSQEKEGLTSRLSLDSLDLSSLEDDTNEVMMRCRMQDKSKYTIAFEESCSSLTTFSDSNDEKNGLEDRASKAINTFMNREMNLTKSDYCYSTWNRLKSRDKENVYDNNFINLRRYRRSKHSKSLPNMNHYLDFKEKNFNLMNEYATWFDSNDSSPSRSLIRYFIQNRFSISSNSLFSSSNSFEVPFGEVSKNGKISSDIFKCNCSSLGLHFTKESNNNENESCNTQSCQKTEDELLLEDSLTLDENVLTQPKSSLNRMMQASPIREEEEPLTDSSKNDVTMTSEPEEPTLSNWRCKEKEVPQSFFRPNPIRSSKSSGILSICNALPFQAMPTRRNSENFCSSSNVKTSRYPACREFGSASSGYQSSRHGSLEWAKKINMESHKPKGVNNIVISKMRSIATQIPVHIQDKEVQTGSQGNQSHLISTEYCTHPLLPKTNNYFSSNENQKDKKAFYVYFPNYSLPDLSFLTRSPGTPLENKNNNVYISPTKIKFREPSARIKCRQNNRKNPRPKSCTDYENLLATQDFNHIKDWDSLNVLLPSRFKSLVARLKEEREKAGQPFKSSNSQAFDSQTVRGSPKKYLRRFCSLDNAEPSEATSKRHSLQEPFNYLNFHLPNQSRITRSTTMPACQCFYQNTSHPHVHSNHHLSHNHHYHSHRHNNYHHCHQQPYPQQSCCSHLFLQSSDCCQLSNSSLNGSLEIDPKLDQLSHLIAMGMNVKEITNIINGHKSRYTSPSNPCDPICEEKEGEGEGKENEANTESETNFATAQLKLRYKDVPKFDETKKYWKSLPLDTNRLNETIYPSEAEVATEEVKEEVPNEHKNYHQPQQYQQQHHQSGLPIYENGLIKKAVRPTSLPTQSFKSMIPIAKGSKSPSLKLASPIQGLKMIKVNQNS